MATRTQVFVYQVDASGGTGALAGTGSLIDPLVVLVHPPLSRQLAGQPHAAKLRLGIGSLADPGGVIEVIDTSDIEVYMHDGTPLAATLLARPSTAAVDPVLPEGTESGKEDFTEADRNHWAQTLMTYLAEAAPPDAVAPTAPPPGPWPSPTDPPWCGLFRILCPKLKGKR